MQIQDCQVGDTIEIIEEDPLPNKVGVIRQLYQGKRALKAKV